MNTSKHDPSNSHGNTVVNCHTRPETVRTVTIFPDGIYGTFALVLHPIARIVWLGPCDEGPFNTTVHHNHLHASFTSSFQPDTF